MGIKGESCCEQVSNLKNSQTKTKNSVNKPQQRGLQLGSLCNFTDRSNCIPQVATEDESGKRVLGHPYTEQSFKRKQNLLFVNVQKMRKPSWADLKMAHV